MIGLTLSGGGAKGAYQVGAVEALVESGVRIDMVSGASIGALNGALISGAPDLRSGAESLRALWRDLGEASPVSVNFLSFFSRVVIPAILSGGRLAPFVLMDDLKLCSSTPLLNLMSKHLDFAALQRGKPFHVSLYESGAVPLLRVALAERGILDTPDSTFMHLQSLALFEQQDALLASAAIPGLYASREIRGVRYSDGGQGGWFTSQGNTPVTPLIEAGCGLIFVIRLSDTNWERPPATRARFIDLRPLQPIRREGGPMNMRDVLNFTPEALESWRLQGYADTKELLTLPHHAKLLRAFGIR